MALSHEEYANRFDGAITIIMVAVMALSALGVIWMNMAVAPECKPSELTYCGEGGDEVHKTGDVHH